MEGLIILGIVLLVIGFVFVGIEMMIPGFGAPGIIGTCCLIAGLFLTAKTVEEGIIILIVVVILLAIMFGIIIVLLTKGKLKSPIILKEKQKKESGYISSSDLEYLLGKKGVASTDLRPAGRAVFDGVEFDVISDGRYISSGDNVEIYRVNNSKLVVREI